MKIRSMFNSVKTKVSNNSPEILVITGVIGVVTATVLACRATIKAKEVKEDKDSQIDMINACEQDGKTIDENNEEVEYTEEDAKKDRMTVKVKAWLKYGKIFAPAVIVGALSISAILFGHNILRKRYISLGSAYTALDKAYAEYRKRVEDKYGEEAEKEIRYGSGSKDQEDIKDPNKPLTCSPFAMFYQEGCTNWTKDPQQNLYFLRLQQAHFNERLKATGRVFLNEVYRALGGEETAEGQSIGWVLDKDHPDTFIDFGIYDYDKPRNRAFVNGYENVILLDFNVTGNILGTFKR